MSMKFELLPVSAKKIISTVLLRWTLLRVKHIFVLCCYEATDTYFSVISQFRQLRKHLQVSLQVTFDQVKSQV